MTEEYTVRIVARCWVAVGLARGQRLVLSHPRFLRYMYPLLTWAVGEDVSTYVDRQ